MSSGIIGECPTELRESQLLLNAYKTNIWNRFFKIFFEDSLLRIVLRLKGRVTGPRKALFHFFFPLQIRVLLDDDNEENLMFSTHILFMTPGVFAPLCMRGHNYPMKCERDIREGLGLLSNRGV